jgi:Cellulose binding domain
VWPSLAVWRSGRESTRIAREICELPKKQVRMRGPRLVCCGQMRALRGLVQTVLAVGWAGVMSCGFPDYVVEQGSPELCDDFLLNGAETDTDCGGADCEGCGQGRACSSDRDCTSRSCEDDKCQAPSCTDGVANGTETGRDCGGNCAEQKCPDGEGCVGGTDCQSQVCSDDECQAPTCEDSTRNGGESDVDCGGGSCDPCSDGSRCDVNRDCVGKLCDRNTCVPRHCTDDEANESESDVDCGGPCAACEAGQICRLDGDCTSKVCSKAVCAAPACDDEVENGTETDLDCGGDACSPCQDGSVCLVGSDCLNGVCQGGECQAATCTDSVKNADEANADCGGGCPDGCLDGQDCLEAADCNSGVCKETCQAPTCVDKVANGTETDVDCGGDCPELCLVGDACRVHDDCVTGACVKRQCTATLQVFSRNTSAAQSQFIRPYLQIRNTGPTAVSAAELELRYFYTNDGAQSEIAECYFATPGCDKISMSVVEMEPALPLADHYLSVKFRANAGTVPVDGAFTFELALHEPSFAEYDQPSDYSWDPTKTSYTAHEEVCLYRNGTLIWGTEPPP